MTRDGDEMEECAAAMEECTAGDEVVECTGPVLGLGPGSSTLLARVFFYSDKMVSLSGASKGPALSRICDLVNPRAPQIDQRGLN
ncbi:hypothetical protein BRADI_1g29368v3 [Brachypodium distachyon]|uniref:Uncharacterized protein n=1 Tax=Brachypodium distachyon TaxID=15368 RepID=A0A2K2DLW3_BRADI|nr:hypothetical protein BRADI_1g29368v3 [Brachypodium distachyon]